MPILGLIMNAINRFSKIVNQKSSAIAKTDWGSSAQGDDRNPKFEFPNRLA